MAAESNRSREGRKQLGKMIYDPKRGGSQVGGERVRLQSDLVKAKGTRARGGNNTTTIVSKGGVSHCKGANAGRTLLKHIRRRQVGSLRKGESLKIHEFKVHVETCKRKRELVQSFAGEKNRQRRRPVLSKRWSSVLPRTVLR